MSDKTGFSQVLAFLQSIEGAGYGGMAEYEIARDTMLTAASNAQATVAQRSSADSEQRWYAVDEVGNDNFATSIYEAGDKGLLVARCNQNGQYPWQAPSIIRGLAANKTARNEPQSASDGHMTYDTIKAAFDEYRKTVTVMDKPANFDSFSQGYVAGWNAKEAAHSQAGSVERLTDKIDEQTTALDQIMTTAADNLAAPGSDLKMTLEFIHHVAEYTLSLTRPERGDKL